MSNSVFIGPSLGPTLNPINSDIIPALDATYTLGDSTHRWDDVATVAVHSDSGNVGDLTVDGSSLGSEILTNPDFTGSATGWTLGAGWSYSANTVVHTPGSTAALSQNFTSVTGQIYRVQVVVTAGTPVAFGMSVAVGDTPDLEALIEDVGTYNFFIMNQEGTTGVTVTPLSGSDFTISSISVKAYTGGFTLLNPEYSADPVSGGWHLFQSVDGDGGLGGPLRLAYGGKTNIDFYRGYTEVRTDWAWVGTNPQVGFTSIGTALGAGWTSFGYELGATATIPAEYAPATLFISFAWDTNDLVSRRHDLYQQWRAVSGATTSGLFAWIYSSDETAQTDLMTLSSAGALTVAGSAKIGTFIEGVEMSAPSAPSANGARIFFQDNGAGKTQACVIFASGAVQVFATQP